MPIIDLQRRMRQLGEIRIGHVVPTGKTRRDGKPGTRPAKLNHFRFTSPSREILAEVAALYGGEVKPWTPANGGPSEFEVYSTTNRLPVLIPPRDAVSQWYELYAGSKCQRRCDGVTEHKKDRPCICDPDNRECSITTRVNVMLRDVPALGQWLLVSKGFYAAVTLPPAAELLAQAGGYVAGWLGMEEKLVQREQGPARFMVPTLDVEITPAALMEGRITGAPAAVATGPERVAITGGRPDYAALAAVATTAEEVGKLWKQAVDDKHMDDALAAVLKTRGEELRAAAAPKEDSGPHPDDVERTVNPADYGDATPEQVEEFVHDVEVVEDDDTEAIWFQIIAAAGPLGLTTDQVEQRFAEANGGLHPGTASAARLRTFLASLKGGQA
ncbi:recombination directionality factor [Streptomyces huasconensis]|uniref:recombination directionality factor n=1 Tax=Streptomyces huasconensis TaxID=1854574 RepID=UPI0037034350